MTRTPTPPSATLACVPVAALQQQALDHLWLIDNLWLEGGVGVLGAPPKHWKSWMAFDMAVSVASGTPCLGSYAVRKPGPVLLFASEDPLPMVRQRIEGLARHRGLDLDSLAVHVITEPVLHLDRPGERQRLENTVAQLRPRLLILDPLVRIYGSVDENSAAEVSGFLGHLRTLQRRFDVAVLLVHHAKKAAGRQAGQALRGSGDLYAWVDTLLYLRRLDTRRVQMAIEHRSAAAPDPVELRFVNDPSESPPHLELLPTGPAAEAGHAASEPLELASRLLSLLTRTSYPQTTEQLRETLRVRKARLVAELERLRRESRVLRGSRGWSLPPSEAQLSLPGLPSSS